MDGISSASGVFAVISIAIQLGESIKKIVEFGKAVQDAPAHICALFQDLEVLAAVISQIEQLNGHVALDNVNEKALRNCQRKILNLQIIIHQAQLRLKSKNLIRRKWGAFKIPLQEDEIQSLQRSIEEAKLTLQLVQTKSLVELVLSSVYNQKQTLKGINALTSLINQPTTEESRFVTHKMHIDYIPAVHPGFKAKQETLLTVNSANISTEKISSANISRHNTAEVKPFKKASRPYDLRFRNCQISRQFNLNTAIFSVVSQSRTWTVKTTRSSEIHETSETENVITVYPKATSRFFGITHGMLLSAQATSGWQYSIQTFRAVEESALVFEFCREGNLDGLKSLFRRGEASPWDRGPEGQTPLLIASQSLHLDVAEFLLREGADPHVSCWTGRSKGDEPIWLVGLNKTVDIEPKLAMINLLQKHRREDYEDLTIGNMLWHILLFYRLQKDINMSWMEKRIAVLKLFSMLMPFFDADNPYRADIIYITVLLYYEQEVLQYILRTTKGYIDLSPRVGSIVHEALHRRLLERDPTSMKLIVKKAKNLHRRSIRSYRDPRTDTPTMLAMYEMKTFLAWRDLLRDLGYEITAFIDQELKEGSLVDDGWTASSLGEIFATEILPDLYCGPTIFGFLTCERCGDNGIGISGKLKVDLVWRRYLRDIRLKHWRKTRKDGSKFPTSSSYSSVWQGTHPTQEASSSSKQGGVQIGARDLPYRIVCSVACLDDVCISWVYEDETDREPDLPPYPYESLVAIGDTEEEIAVVVEEESCPTEDMPGAFKDG